MEEEEWWSGRQRTVVMKAMKSRLEEKEGVYKTGAHLSKSKCRCKAQDGKAKKGGGQGGSTGEGKGTTGGYIPWEEGGGEVPASAGVEEGTPEGLDCRLL